jgi:uncharacterized protein (TIGR02271 family)
VRSRAKLASNRFSAFGHVIAPGISVSGRLGVAEVEEATMAYMTSTTVVGIFRDYQTAQTVAQELRSSGFSDVRVSGGEQDTGWSERDSGEGRGIMGFFRDLFGSDDRETSYYQDAIQSGNAMVTVDCGEERCNKAADIMNRHGAIDVDTNASSGEISEDMGARGRPIPVIEEQLQVGKRVVRRGGVRIYSHVTNHPVEEDVTLREEHVRVDRHPADRPVSEEDISQLRDQTIEISETAEEPVVGKRARVVEEVSVGKETSERKEKIRDQVRKTDVKVERLGGESGLTDLENTDLDDTDFRQHFESRYAPSGARYETYEPAYRYGYRMANEERYRGKSWGDVETDLESDFRREHPGSTWEDMKGAVREGWEKITGRRRYA